MTKRTNAKVLSGYLQQDGKFAHWILIDGDTQPKKILTDGAIDQGKRVRVEGARVVG